MSDTWVMGFFAVWAVVLGACLGSFVNVAVERWSEYRSMLPPSACETCGQVIRWRDLVPVWSFVWLRGRCRDCNTPLSPVYPLVEALNGLVALLVFWRFVPDYAHLTPPNIAAFGVYLVFFSALLVSLYADVRFQILPDEVTLYAVPAAVLGIGLLVHLGFTGFPTPNVISSLLGALFFSGLLYSAGWIGRWLFGKEGMGFGDVKLGALIGAMVGFLPGSWVVLLVSSLGASAFGLLHLLRNRRVVYLPFAPSLALATMVYVLWGDTVIPWFLPTLMANEPALTHLFGG